MYKYIAVANFFTDRLHSPNTDSHQYFSNLKVLKNLRASYYNEDSNSTGWPQILSQQTLSLASTVPCVYLIRDLVTRTLSPYSATFFG